MSAYLNSLGNGFAYDDNWVIVENPVVTDARLADAFTEPAWPGAREGTGNYRPLLLTSFALEWRIFGGHALGFHIVNVAAHIVASLLALALLARFIAVPAALLGALLFAVHPVHVEAVANVMGRAELYAAVAYLGACLLYLDVRPVSAWGRAARLLGLVVLFLAALGSKEIAVSLPGALIVLELFRRGDELLGRRLRGEWPVYLALAGVLGCYVLVRGSVLGDLTGASPAPGLLTLTTSERLLTALAVWPQYLRLMLFPLDLSADYAPGVLLVSRTLSPESVLGLLILGSVLVAAWLLRARAPTAALGLAWFFVTVLPVSNLLVRADVLLAERTLYLPSLGLAFVLGGLAHHVVPHMRIARGRAFAGLVGIGLVAMMVRTVTRNPTWMDTYSVLNTLAVEHPESWLALRGRATGLVRIGATAEAAEAFELALRFAPDHYQLLVEVADFHAGLDNHDRAEALLADAIRLLPTHPAAYAALAEQRLARGDGRAAHAAALAGLARSGADRQLWALVSESYVAKGDLPAAIRARRAALAQAPDSDFEWARLAEILEENGQLDEADAARRRTGGVAAPSGPGEQA